MRTFKHKMINNAIMRTLCYGCAFLLFAGSCTNDNTTADDKENNTGVPAGATAFIGNSLPEATTRTAILNHTKGGGATVNWSNNDKIWVKNDAGQWEQSASVTFPTAANKARGQFALTGTYTGLTHDVLYTNTTVTGSQAQVDIKTAQTQTAPNNFDHAGEAGDCGIATASKTRDGYAFTLSHKASYLCLIPRTNNAFVKRSKLIKVEIVADNNIAGQYNMAADGTLSLASNGSKTITVTTGSGFALDNEADDMSKNATYAVVAPGKHSFRIRYWLSNATDNYDGTIEGTVTKYVTLDCKPGTIHDITANLDPQDYAGLYYLWDAKKKKSVLDIKKCNNPFAISPFLRNLADRTTQKTNLQLNESERIKRVEQQVVALTINVRLNFNTILLCFKKTKTVRCVEYQQTEVRSMLHLV